MVDMLIRFSSNDIENLNGLWDVRFHRVSFAAYWTRQLCILWRQWGGELFRRLESPVVDEVQSEVDHAKEYVFEGL